MDSGGSSSASPSQHLAARHGNNDHHNEESQYKGIDTLRNMNGYRPADEREAAAWTALGEVIDPELGLPITDLGLIYRVDVATPGP